MTVQEAAKSVMKITNTTQQQIAERAGLAGQGTIGMYLHSKSMRVEALITILSGCGYELVARDPSGRYPEFVIGEETNTQRKPASDSNMEDMIRKIVAEEVQKMAANTGRK